MNLMSLGGTDGSPSLHPGGCCALNRAQHAAPGPVLFMAISLQFLFALADLCRDHGDNNRPQAFPLLPVFVLQCFSAVSFKCT